VWRMNTQKIKRLISCFQPGRHFGDFSWEFISLSLSPLMSSYFPFNAYAVMSHSLGGECGYIYEDGVKYGAAPYK
jgi:hypothetical protein